MMQKLRVPGVGVVVIKDVNVHWAKSYGVADGEEGGRCRPTAWFRLCRSAAADGHGRYDLVQEERLSHSRPPVGGSPWGFAISF